ncbi:MAG: hypothetical protein AB8G95_04310 [Anaerolineae bacterium]
MKTKLLINLIVICCTAFALVACGNESPQPIPNNGSQEVDVSNNNDNGNIEAESVAVQIDPPAVAPAEAGTASITGSIYSLTYNQPIVGIPVSLSEIIRDESGEGVYVYDPAFSPTTDSLPGGYFVIENVEPGEYVVVVGNVEINTYKIVAEDDGLPKIFDAPADQITELPVIEVEGLDIYINGPVYEEGYPGPEGYPEPESDS